MLSDQYVEAIATLRAPGKPAPAERWLAARDLQTRTMRAALLIQGNLRAFESAFGVDLRQALPPVNLPVPPELRDTVAAITIPAPRRYL
jgi:hypothetical protein